MNRLLNFFKKIYSLIPCYLRSIVLIILLFFLAIFANLYMKNNNNNYKDIIILDVNKKTTGSVKINLESSPKIPSIRKNTKRNDALYDLKDDYFFGSKNAKITIIEYSNYNCPHCIKLHNDIMYNIKNNFIDKNEVKYVKRIFIQKNTLLAVMLPYCAEEQYRYNLVEELYNNIDDWIDSPKQKEILEKISMRYGFTKNNFNNCIKNHNLANKIIKKQRQDIKNFKIFSTPTLFIEDKRINGNVPYNDLKIVIEEKLNKIKNR